MKPGSLWPLAIGAVLALTVGANAWVLYEANRDPNGAALESDYYRKAVAYDSILTQSRRDVALGWRLDATPGAFDPAGTALTVRLTDRDGRPLAGARVDLVAIHNLEAGRELFASFVTGEDGRATRTLGLRHAGLWELRFDARRAGDRFTSDLRRNVPAGGSGATP
jgi:nitrogen fixation protein FixH